jgi:hypothetical protein
MWNVVGIQKIHLRYGSTLFALCAALSACTGSSSSTGAGSSSPVSSGVSGTVSAGPVGGATVKAYSLNADGTQGALISTATTNSSGKYTLNMSANAGPVVIVASGGSYTEEASGLPVSMGSAQLRVFLPSVSDGQSVGVTPVTEIAAQSAMAAVGVAGNTTDVKSIIQQANVMVGNAVGISDITQPPADPTKAASQASSTQAAKYAVVLGAISQMASAVSTAHTTTVTSLDVAQALAVDFAYNQSFSGSQVTVSGTAKEIPIGNSGATAITLGTALSDAGGATFSDAMSAATTAYTSSSTAIANGFDGTSVSYTDGAAVPTGDAALTPPTVTLLSSLGSSTSVTTSGPAPAPPPEPYITYGSPNVIATVGYAISSITPTTLTASGSCTISPSLPAGLMFNSTTCVISGTPTAAAASARYTVTASNSANKVSIADPIVLEVDPVVPHLYLSNLDGGSTVVSCALNSSSGAVSSCGTDLIGTAGTGIPALALATTTVGGTTKAYFGLSSELTTCTLTAPTGQLSGCTTSNNTPITSSYESGWAQQIPIDVAWGAASSPIITPLVIGNTTYLYTISNTEVDVCTAGTGGLPTSCRDTNAGLNVYLQALDGNATGNNPTCASNNSTCIQEQWAPSTIDFYTGTNGIYAYITDGGAGGSYYTGQSFIRSENIYICHVSSTDGTLSNCAVSSAATKVALWNATGFINETNSLGIHQTYVKTIESNHYLYITTGVGNIFQCSISNTDGSLSACAVTNGGLLGDGKFDSNGNATSSGTTNVSPQWYPQSMTITNLGGSQYHAYVTDSLNKQLFICNVSATDGKLSGCASSATAQATLNQYSTPYSLFVF